MVKTYLKLYKIFNWININLFEIMCWILKHKLKKNLGDTQKYY